MVAKTLEKWLCKHNNSTQFHRISIRRIKYYNELEVCRTRHECPALRAVIEGYASSSGGHLGYGSWVNTDYRTRARYSFKQFMVPIWWQSDEI